MQLDDDLTAEVIPNEDTLRKALINLLCLRRMYSDTNIITAFCFPKLKQTSDKKGWTTKDVL